MTFIYFQVDNRTKQFLQVQIVGKDINLIERIDPTTARQLGFSEETSPSRVARGFEASFKVMADANDQTGTDLMIVNGKSPIKVDISGRDGAKVMSIISRFTVWNYSLNGANVNLDVITRP